MVDKRNEYNTNSAPFLANRAMDVKSIYSIYVRHDTRQFWPSTVILCYLFLAYISPSVLTNVTKFVGIFVRIFRT